MKRRNKKLGGNIPAATGWTEGTVRQAIQALVGQITQLRRYFPERQIYLRSNGEVRYVAVSTRAQICAAAVAGVVIGWVGLTSLEFLSRDLVLEARDAQIRDLQEARRAQDADMQLLERDILERAQRLEERQKYLGEILGEELHDQGAVANTSEPPVNESQDSQKGAFLDIEVNPVYASFSPRFERPRKDESDSQADGYLLYAEMRERLDSVQDEQDGAARLLTWRARNQISGVEEKLAKTGVTTERLLSKWQPPAATGGPYVAATPLPEFIGDARDATSAVYFEELDAEWMRLNMLGEAVARFPATIPADDYYVSSRYGRRTDPYTKVRAMHYGLDMAGWPGTNVRNAAPGRVVRAGRWGPYGRMIEIEHGNGFRTRYGHLRRLHVERGDVLEAGQAIGEMGCSGRCTSTHLHYEVWFDGKPQNPLAYLEVSEDVLKIQRGIE